MSSGGVPVVPAPGKRTFLSTESRPKKGRGVWGNTQIWGGDSKVGNKVSLYV